MTADGSQTASPARAAAAAEAAAMVEPGMALGLGSGRALWATIERIAARWPEGPPVRAVCASTRTEEVAREAGIEVVELDGALELDLALDGADEIDPALCLVKGGGGALLREKLVIGAARRFVVVAEALKRVERLGLAFALPVEVVPFAWRETRRRVMDLVADAELRTDPRGGAYVTDGGNHILDCHLRPEGDLDELAAALKAMTGVVEHGLFLGMADLALLGTEDGGVERLERPAARS